MELQHRFEVPVGIEAAWPHLLDMEKVAACFPGATLSSSDGDEYTGTVKVKLGPIQLTYAGKAKIVSADEATHTATIEASGAAARSGSTASMTVVAVASAVSEDRTAVDMTTDLTITGKPAQFGRGVMVEVGNKILGMFADCLSGKLAEATAGGGSESGAAAGSEGGGTEYDDTQGDSTSVKDAGAEGSAAADGDAGKADSGAGAAGAASAGAGAGAASGGGAAAAAGAGSAEHRTYTRTPDMSEPIDLLESARGSIIKRLIPVAVGAVMLILWRLLRNRRRQS